MVDRIRRRCSAFVAFALFSGCIPADTSRDRGAIYITIDPAILAVAPANDFATWELDLTRTIVSISAVVPDCHFIYYVERPPPALAVLDLSTSYQFQHRSISEGSCKVLVGFNALDGVAVRGPGVTAEEFALFSDPLRGATEGILLEGRIVGSFFDSETVKRFHLVLSGLTGVANSYATVRSGERTDLAFAFDARSVLDDQNLLSLLSFADDVGNADGIVTEDECTFRFGNVTLLEELRNRVSNSWRSASPHQ